MTKNVPDTENFSQEINIPKSLTRILHHIHFPEGNFHYG